MINCILAGVGGQGTILASKLIAQTAMNKGLNARTAETIGMAQRGGSVVSHVRIGENIHSPLIPLNSADIIIGFEPAEAVRSLKFLKKTGTVVVSKKAIKPTTDSLSNSSYEGNDMIDYLRERVDNLIVVDGEKICAKCESIKVLNVALLGAAVASGILRMTLKEVEVTMKKRLPEKFISMNLKALSEGAQTVLKENGR